MRIRPPATGPTARAIAAINGTATPATRAPRILAQQTTAAHAPEATRTILNATLLVPQQRTAATTPLQFPAMMRLAVCASAVTRGAVSTAASAPQTPTNPTTVRHVYQTSMDTHDAEDSVRIRSTATAGLTPFRDLRATASAHAATPTTLSPIAALALLASTHQRIVPVAATVTRTIPIVIVFAPLVKIALATQRPSLATSTRRASATAPINGSETTAACAMRSLTKQRVLRVRLVMRGIPIVPFPAPSLPTAVDRRHPLRAPLPPDVCAIALISGPGIVAPPAQRCTMHRMDAEVVRLGSTSTPRATSPARWPTVLQDLPAV